MSRISITESRVHIKDNPFRACCIALAGMSLLFPKVSIGNVELTFGDNRHAGFGVAVVTFSFGVGASLAKRTFLPPGHVWE